MQVVIDFMQAHKPFFDAAAAMSSLVNLVGWCVGAVLLTIAWRRNAIRSVTFGPVNFQVQEAVAATATAARDWKSDEPGGAVDVPRIRQTIEQAFTPETIDAMIGKSILWVDDNPSNNLLPVRALKKLQLDVEQAVSTELGLAALKERHFDLVISDMGRGDDNRAGYDLLAEVRKRDKALPYFIFAGSDTPEYRREAAELGAQLSTNDLIELIDNVIKVLGKKRS